MSLVISQLSRVWSTYDHDHDGLLNVQEFTRFMHSRAVSRWFCDVQISVDILENVFNSIEGIDTGFEHLVSFPSFYKILDVDKFQTRLQFRVVLDEVLD